ncbi:MAG: hypothetical protein HZB29_04205 [Nitrospinae bacterium]|nr:hypothetical protein [Nitrospinota bacterium]
MSGVHTLDYRGKSGADISDELREMLLTRRPDVMRVDVLVDSVKAARKIETYAAIVECPSESREEGNHWVVSVSPPICKR